ncbi:MAG: hypothetical protein V1887_02405 [Candidatus Aenigmatarchaeota archaeon]
MLLPKEKFVRFKEKYPHIPEWDWLNKNFRLKLEEDTHLLEQVRASVSEKLDVLARSTIEPILAGGESYCCYFERKMLTDVQKEELWDIYRQLQALLWRSNALSVDFSDKETANWLSDVKGTMERVKPRMLAICGRLADGWTKYKRETAETAYHG